MPLQLNTWLENKTVSFWTKTITLALPESKSRNPGFCVYETKLCHVF